MYLFLNVCTIFRQMTSTITDNLFHQISVNYINNIHANNERTDITNIFFGPGQIAVHACIYLLTNYVYIELKSVVPSGLL